MFNKLKPRHLTRAMQVIWLAEIWLVIFFASLSIIYFGLFGILIAFVSGYGYYTLHKRDVQQHHNDIRKL